MSSLMFTVIGTKQIALVSKRNISVFLLANKSTFFSPWALPINRVVTSAYYHYAYSIA